MRNILFVLCAVFVLCSLGCTAKARDRFGHNFAVYTSTMDGDAGKRHPQAWKNTNRTRLLHRGGGLNTRITARYGPVGRRHSDDIRNNSSIGQDQEDVIRGR